MKDFITLGQYLKFINIISSGGEAKIFLSEYPVLVNGQSEDRRGRKLRQGDVVEVDGQSFTVAL